MALDLCEVSAVADRPVHDNAARGRPRALARITIVSADAVQDDVVPIGIVLMLCRSIAEIAGSCASPSSAAGQAPDDGRAVGAVGDAAVDPQITICHVRPGGRLRQCVVEALP